MEKKIIKKENLLSVPDTEKIRLLIEIIKGSAVYKNH